MAENIVVSSDTQNQSADVPESNSKNIRKSFISVIIDKIAESVGNLTRSGNSNSVKEDVINILNTIAAMNATEEHDVGIRVGDVLYRFNEYQATAGLANLVVASRVVLSDVISAINFFDREKFVINGAKVLSPAEFAKAVHKVCASIRTNPSFVQLNKPTVALLADSNKYAVNNRKVEDSHQKYITFLKGQYDGEKLISVNEWAVELSLTLFS